METINHITTTAQIINKEPLDLDSGFIHHITVKRSYFYLLEFHDIVFRNDSAAFMPDKIIDATSGKSTNDGGIKPIVNTFKFLSGVPRIAPVQNRYKHLLITGHTDTSGSPDYNKKLSINRAVSIYSILDNNRNAWCDLYKGKMKNGAHTYCDEDIQQLLCWISSVKKWPCHPGKIDGVIGEKTKDATLKMQENYNSEYYQAIKTDSVFGEECWGAVFDIMQDEISKQVDGYLDSVGLKNTRIGQLRSEIRWYNYQNDGIHSICGCGENWPIEAAEKDNYHSQTNRRVELLFFDPDEIIPLSCHTGKCADKNCHLFGKDASGVNFFNKKIITDPMPSQYKFSV